jgi:hypothetical protein
MTQNAAVLKVAALRSWKQNKVRVVFAFHAYASQLKSIKTMSSSARHASEDHWTSRVGLDYVHITRNKTSEGWVSVE